MQVSVGGTRTTLALVATLLLTSLLAGCLGSSQESQESEIPEGEGLVTLWMSRPANAAEYDVQVLKAVPRFIAFTAADEETIERLNSTRYIALSTGWTEKEDGWADGEYPRSAAKNWLYTHDIWFQDTLPAGNYSHIRVEVIDQHIVMWNSQPRLYIGTTQEASGYPRITFQPDPQVGTFEVKEGEELVLNFQTELALESGGRVVIQ